MQVEAGRFGAAINALSSTGFAAGAEHLSANGELVDETGAFQPNRSPRVWRDGVSIDLAYPTGIGRVDDGEAMDVNEDGLSIGFVTTKMQEYLPIAWTPDGLGTLLEMPVDGHGRPWVINDHSIVGGSVNQRLIPGDSGSYVPVPIVWQNLCNGDVSPQTLPFPESQPRPSEFPGLHLAQTFIGLTDSGAVIAGYSSHLSQVDYRYEQDQPVRLNEGFDFEALAANKWGTIVGARIDRDLDRTVLVLYERGAFRDLDDELPDLGDLMLRSIVAINSNNQILASAIDTDGALVGLVFTPLD